MFLRFLGAEKLTARRPLANMILMEKRKWSRQRAGHLGSLLRTSGGSMSAAWRRIRTPSEEAFVRDPSEDIPYFKSAAV